jgi:nucleotidyltransferase substrate binding protein (TIGR01987 family)
MSKNQKWEMRFQNYSKALLQLEIALQQKEFSVLEKDGVIKRFEFTFELAWKTLQDVLNDHGYPDLKGPKPIIKQAFQDKIITDGQEWIDMLVDRNNSSHLYDENASREIFDKIFNKYFLLLNELKIFLQDYE